MNEGAAMKIRIFIIFFLCLPVLFVSAQGFPGFPAYTTGDSAIAEKYRLWAEEAIAAGNWQRAMAALERAADFTDVSSDISYLTAVAYAQADESRRLILHNLEQAIQTGRWKYYTEAQARLFQADQLIVMRHYSAALETLAICASLEGDNADIALLRLAALKGSGRNAEFRRHMHETLDHYPRDTRPLHILFRFAAEHKPADDDALMNTAFTRLPFLLGIDPDLAWEAAPFISNADEARLLVASYRSASFRPKPASVIPALNLGLIDDFEAVDELFGFSSEPVLDRYLITRVWELLRSEEGREYLAKKLRSFSGTITEDEDRDGYPESRAVYRQGVLQEYYYDYEQDSHDDLFIIFESGIPRWAEIVLLPSSGTVSPFNQNSRAFIFWEKYPAVQRTVLDKETCLYSPDYFRFTPIGFSETGASESTGGLMYPRLYPGSRDINRRLMVSMAVNMYRPCSEFEGGVEHIHFQQGIPLRAEVTLNGLLVSVTEFENGMPFVQRIDMDVDGVLETVRRFRKITPGEFTSSEYRPRLESVENTRDGSGIFGSEKLYRNDGSVVYSWDFNGDGIREYFLVIE